MDILGIDFEQIPDCQEAINKYVKKADDIIANITADAGNVRYTAGIKGTEQREALQGYIQDAVNKIKIVTNNLNEFSKALNTVRSNYETQQGNVADNMSNVSEVEITSTTGVSGFGD